MSQDSETPKNQSGQTIIVNQIEKNSNGIGTAGFVLAILGIFLGWIPIIGWLIWILGLIFSFAGLFKSPKGLAIAGFVISIFGIFLLLAGIGVLLGSLGM